MHFNYYISKGEWQKTVEEMGFYFVQKERFLSYALPWHECPVYLFLAVRVDFRLVQTAAGGGKHLVRLCYFCHFFRATVTVETGDSFYVHLYRGGKGERLHKVLFSSHALLPNARSRNGKWTKSLLFLLLFSLPSYFSSVRRNSRRPRERKTRSKY